MMLGDEPAYGTSELQAAGKPEAGSKAMIAEGHVCFADLASTGPFLLQSCIRRPRSPKHQ
jgi:hypothetical protein